MIKQITLLVVLIFLASSNVGFSQQNDNLITYDISGVYMEFFNDVGEKVTSKPIGRNAFVGVDEFFKSYTMIYEGENGSSESLSFSYISDMEDGMLRVKDKFDNIFYLADNLKTDNKIVVVAEKKVKNMVYIIAFR